jgi:hypothetical protein
MSDLLKIGIADCSSCKWKCTEPYHNKIVYLVENIFPDAYSDCPGEDCSYCSTNHMKVLPLTGIAKALYE